MARMHRRTAGVFSLERTAKAPQVELPKTVRLNVPLRMDSLDLLEMLPAGSFPAAFFDPQYRGILDKMSYGNEGVSRGAGRSGLLQMTESMIAQIVAGIDSALTPGGHLFLWMDKFHLCSGFSHWISGTELGVVDMVTWDKDRIGMGYRTRRASEHLVVLQKSPRRAKGVWRSHKIPDVWKERTECKRHPHCKPVGLQGELIAAVTDPGDIVIDPAAGSFSVLEACRVQERNFVGGDIAADDGGVGPLF